MRMAFETGRNFAILSIAVHFVKGVGLAAVYQFEIPPSFAALSSRDLLC